MDEKLKLLNEKMIKEAEEYIKKCQLNLAYLESLNDIPFVGFNPSKFDAISKKDCDENYKWADGGINSEYYKRYIKRWVDAGIYPPSYQPACAMGIHLWLKIAGLDMPWLDHRGYHFSNVGTFKNWGEENGFYTIDKWEIEIPKNAIIIFYENNNGSYRYYHIGMVPKKVEKQQKEIITREVNYGRAVVETTRPRTKIHGFLTIPKGYLY